MSEREIMTRTMNSEERERRKRNYVALAEALTVLTNRDRGEFEIYRYSELIVEAINELTAEQKRLQGSPDPAAKPEQLYICADCGWELTLTLIRHHIRETHKREPYVDVNGNYQSEQERQAAELKALPFRTVTACGLTVGQLHQSLAAVDAEATAERKQSGQSILNQECWIG